MRVQTSQDNQTVAAPQIWGLCRLRETKEAAVVHHANLTINIAISIDPLTPKQGPAGSANTTVLLYSRIKMKLISIQHATKCFNFIVSECNKSHFPCSGLSHLIPPQNWNKGLARISMNASKLEDPSDKIHEKQRSPSQLTNAQLISCCCGGALHN